MLPGELNEPRENQPESVSTGCHPVLVELGRRWRGEAGKRRLALAIEGGGMRGVVSAGMVAALEGLGVRPSIFDAVFGASAGALNGAYYLAGQAALGTSIYYEDLVGPEFIDFRRAVFSGSVLDLDYLIYHVMVARKPLRAEDVVKTGALFSIATDIDAGAKRVFGPPSDSEGLRKQLRAGATVPLIAGRPIQVEGQRYMDATLCEAIPWETPIDQGFDFVLVLRTHVLGEARPPSLARQIFDSLLPLRFNPRTQKLIRQRMRTRQTRAELLKTFTLAPSSPPYVYAICPSMSDICVHQLERLPQRLIAGAQAGYLAVVSALAAQPPVHFNTRGALSGVFQESGNVGTAD